MTAAVPRIFVSIASYRDPECQWTIKDLFEKAALPDRVVVGLCWQYLAGEDDDCFLFGSRGNQCRVVEFNALDSLGACWARHQVQSLWQGEEYYLQIDSHMRFEADWDEILLAMLAQCPSARSVLSTYPPAYTPPDTLHRGSLPVLLPRHFDKQGIVALRSQMFPLANAPSRPFARPFCSGGLFFSSSAVVREVPYDPHLYFTGEEITLAVRLWTHGWDIFAPNRNVVYHDYGHARRRHWQDNKDWGTLSGKAAKRLRHLFRMDVCSDSDIVKDIECYGLGHRRTLESFEAVSGVSFKARTIEDRTIGPPWHDRFSSPDEELGVGATPLQRARALAKESKDEAAIAAFDEALAEKPTLANAAFGKANVLLKLRRSREAADAYELAAKEQAYRAEALYGRAIVLDLMGRWEEAEVSLEQAAAVRQELRYLRFMVGIRYRRMDLAGAENAARQAIEMAPDDAAIHYSLALVMISGGRHEGWIEYEWRWKRSHMQSQFRYGELERWQGEPLAGRHLLLWAEQGLCDEVMFARHLPLVISSAGTVTVECAPRLVPLMARSFPAARMIARTITPLPGFTADVACPFGSLAAVTGRGFEATPFPFLLADPEKSAVFRKLLRRDSELLVAIAWRPALAVADAPRPMAIKDWKPILSVPGVRFVVVQVRAAADELVEGRAASAKLEVVPVLDPDQDLDGLAAVLAACDLYIGVDTVAAHLACALGREAWVILPHRVEWLWPPAGEIFPAYPTVRMLRQDRHGDWEGVLTRVGRALSAHVAQRRA